VDQNALTGVTQAVKEELEVPFTATARKKVQEITLTPKAPRNLIRESVLVGGISFTATVLSQILNVSVPMSFKNDRVLGQKRPCVGIFKAAKE
jgi:hypothetical protein